MAALTAAAVAVSPSGPTRLQPLAPLRRPVVSRVLLAPATLGVAGALGLLAFYLGMITLAQGWGHAVEQLGIDRGYVAAIMAGFGTQVALFTYVRRLHAAHAQAAAGGMAMSTGTSAVAMLACCAHHLIEVFAVLGLAGASVFLLAYKTPLLWVGIGMNGAGIAYLVWQLVKARRAIADAAPACH